MKKIILVVNLILIVSCFFQNLSSASDKQRQRIISLAPATTEILFSLGLDEEIVGVTTFCNYPLAAEKKEKVGTFSQPNIEKILSLKPDLVLATGLEQAYIVGKLKQIGLKVYVSDPSTIGELMNSIKEIGHLTHRESEASVVVAGMEAKIRQISEKVKLIDQDKKPKVFIEIWHDPLMAAGQGSFVDELITLVGGINIAHDTPRAYSYFSPEQVIERNPDCIIFGYMSDPENQINIKGRMGWDKIKAVKANHLYNDINPDLFLRPGPRLADGLEEIYERLYNK
ncbi:MAG: cobalamin-binding protein [Candidatus Omnitrophica bacterium]|nr:cobalamin-binding protein [Candidatus Omnitrophota bacterium]